MKQTVKHTHKFFVQKECCLDVLDGGANIPNVSVSRLFLLAAPTQAVIVLHQDIPFIATLGSTLLPDVGVLGLNDKVRVLGLQRERRDTGRVNECGCQYYH